MSISPPGPKRGPLPKSDEIQHRYREILVDPDIMCNFHYAGAKTDADYERSDELVELTEQLIVAINDLINNKLTSRQSEVVKKIYFEQKTQMEVADSLGLCQTTIHKILKGNLDYSNGGKRYGGALKKLKKLCAANPDIQRIIDRITELKVELAVNDQ